ncbi:hypothetical protein TBR22_A24630 [Luteitalea sp. TBR-22]|uniref:hypothetical protein n=1 Tax=Luteitalea sp. TBR-22 TaxID=2802971 RepID=UPI001AF8F108|nr:hypothetical protein [Luteitalea sp. TBR-22]BCS33236.1 hypothetical protein TBR22_A24630 [Luteitalea sp. TBR-22]
MPIQAFLAAVLAFLACLFAVVAPMEPMTGLDLSSADGAFQWGLFWVILAGIGVGLGRQLDEPIARLLPFAPTGLLLLVFLSSTQPGTTLHLGRMRVPVPAVLLALVGVGLSGLAWYAGTWYASRAHRYLEDQSRD